MGNNKRIKERDWCVGVGVDKKISQNAFLRGGNEFIRQVGFVHSCMCVCVYVCVYCLSSTMHKRSLVPKIAGKMSE